MFFSMNTTTPRTRHTHIGRERATDGADVVSCWDGGNRCVKALPYPTQGGAKGRRDDRPPPWSNGGEWDKDPKPHRRSTGWTTYFSERYRANKRGWTMAVGISTHAQTLRKVSSHRRTSHEACRSPTRAGQDDRLARAHVPNIVGCLRRHWIQMTKRNSYTVCALHIPPSSLFVSYYLAHEGFRTSHNTVDGAHPSHCSRIQESSQDQRRSTSYRTSLGIVAQAKVTKVKTRTSRNKGGIAN